MGITRVEGGEGEKKARKNTKSGREMRSEGAPKREKSRKIRKEGKTRCSDEEMERRGKGWDTRLRSPQGLEVS